MGIGSGESESDAAAALRERLQRQLDDALGCGEVAKIGNSVTRFNSVGHAVNGAGRLMVDVRFGVYELEALLSKVKGRW